MLRNMLAWRRDPLAFLLDLHRREGDVARFWAGPHRCVLLSSPDAIRRVLVDRQENYRRQTPGFDKLRSLLGDGLLTSDGALWQRQRRSIQPAFHRGALQGFTGRMTELTREMLSGWEATAAGSEPFDLLEAFTELTLSTVGWTLFSVREGEAMRGVLEWMPRALHHLDRVARNPFWRPWFLWTPWNRRFRHALRALRAAAGAMIEERRANPGEGPEDLLDLLVRAAEEVGDRQIADEILTMFMAGHETTTSALTWAFVHFHRCPQQWKMLRQEADEVLGERDPEPADLERLVRAKRAFQEVLRLHPPVWLLGRRAVEEDCVEGKTITARTLVYLSPYVTHRHPEHWDEPERFDPDRFAPGERERPTHAYIPFGGGGHTCVGNAFAIAQAQIALSMIARRFDLQLVRPDEVVAEPCVTLRPRGGLLVRAIPRRVNRD